MKFNFKHTIYACYIGYIVQAIINNFAPLLFVMFQSSYGISLDKIALLVTFNFGVQFVVDIAASKYADKIGYRAAMIIANIFAAGGLISMTILPDLFSEPFIGLAISVAIYAIGGGLLEVLVSPIVEACPTDNKEGSMSLLHSFYCWGHVAVVLLSTLFFSTMGINNWKLLALFWALIPMANMVLFAKVPILTLEESTGEQLGLRALAKNKVFWVMMLLMVCAGASEQSVSQWASAFAEEGLGVSKTIGDLAGPMAFAILMGTARALYAKFSEKIKLEKFMVVSGILCLSSYLLISLSKSPILALLGCALCGFSVGILWPGVFSMASKNVRGGGTAMFALLALAGDLGCAGGPTYVGYISEFFDGSLKIGILFAAIIPAMLIVGLVINKMIMAKKIEEYSI